MFDVINPKYKKYIICQISRLFYVDPFCFGFRSVGANAWKRSKFCEYDAYVDLKVSCEGNAVYREWNIIGDAWKQVKLILSQLQVMNFD